MISLADYFQLHGSKPHPELTPQVRENARSVGRREVDKAIHSRAKEMAERLEQIKNRKKSLAEGWRSDRRAGRMARQNNWFVRLIGGKA